MKDKTTAALLAFFLGGIGIHHFYLGNKSKGILFLVFFWTFIPAIIAFFESIMLLMQSQAEFDAKYNSTTEPVTYSRPTTFSNNVADELEKLHSLKEKGVITAEEFEAKKKKML